MLRNELGKRLLSLALCLVMLLSYVPVSAQGEEIHDYDQPQQTNMAAPAEEAPESEEEAPQELFEQILSVEPEVQTLTQPAVVSGTGNTVTLNGTGYATFADAYAAAQQGDTITLLADTQLPDNFTIETDLTLNLNGFELSQPGRWTFITGKTVINGPGKFDFVLSRQSGEVTVDGGAELPNVAAEFGTVIVRNAKIESLLVGDQGVVKVYGGTIDFLCLEQMYESVLLCGGSYETINLNAFPLPATLGGVLGEGYTYFPEVDLTLSNAENVSVIPLGCYAIIGNTAYESLTTALSAAKSGDTVTLIRSQSIPAGDTVTIPDGVTLTNAAGVVLSNEGTLRFPTIDSCALTELDNKGTLQVNWKNQWQPAVFVEHTLYLDGGDVTNEACRIANDDSATYYTAGEGYVLYDGKGTSAENWGTVYLHDATITSPNSTRDNTPTDKADVYCVGITFDHARLIFSGTNTITCGSSYASTMGLYARELILTGEGENPVLNLRGGPAEIASYGLACGNLTVTAGTVNATGGSTTGQSIGASVSGNITVQNGAVLNATGGTVNGDYGISSGLGVQSGLTVEEGGVVNATGGSSETISLGAVLLGSKTSSGIVVNGTLNVQGGSVSNDAPTPGLYGSMGLVIQGDQMTVGSSGTVNGLVAQLDTLVDENDTLSGYAVRIAAYGNAVMQGDLDVDGFEKAYAESGTDVTTTFTVPEGTGLTVEKGVTLDLREMSRETVSIQGTLTNHGTILCDHDGRESEATCVSLPVCAICKQEYGTLNPDRHDPNAEYDENGICSGGCYEPAQLVDGVYQIGNAGNLYWFAQLVNGGTVDANALVTRDLTVNENVLAEDGTLNEGSFRAWTPIGKNDSTYSGTFDGGKHTISGLYSADNAKSAGLVGTLCTNGVVKNLNLTDSYFCGKHYIGGIVGDNQGTVENCSNAASVVGESIQHAGGIVGYNQATVRNCRNTGKITSRENAAGGIVGGNIGTVENCCATGVVTALHHAGGIVGTNVTLIRDSSGRPVNAYPVIKNCYYLDTCCEKGDDTPSGISVAKTAAAFASGEVTYLLNGDQSAISWYQTCGTGLPAFEGQQVYSGYLTCGMDAAKSYSNDSAIAKEPYDHEGGRANCHEKAVCDNCHKPYGEIDTTHHDEAVAYANGFCPYGCYEPAQLVDGVYQIGNAGNLYWFAQLVNGGTADAKAILTDDIDVNEDVIDVLGSLNQGTFRTWTPIGTQEQPYSGTFNGGEHTIFGLYLNDKTANDAGLFGILTGTVKCLKIDDSFFQAGQRVGSVAGTNRGSILDCYAFNTVIGNSAVGGIAGQSDGRLERVHNGGTVRAEFSISGSGMIQGGGTVGGVTGILNGTMTASQNTGKVQAAYSNAGGLVGTVSASGSVVTSSNRGTVSGKSSIGGIAGASAGTVASSYSVGTASGTGSSIGGCVGKSTGTLKDCYYLADSQSEDGGMTDLQFISGEVTYLLNGDQSAIGWYQTCGLGYPALEGQRVYYGYTTCSEQGEIVYTNTPATATRPEHTDDPRDHICDICGESVGEHKAGTGKHTCDYCGEAMSQCADENRDHKCDICTATLSQCADENRDHKCDLCNATVSQCADENKDHKCDLCNATVSQCADENKDHKCDTCNATLSQCADENKDHKCDLCNATLSQCADEDKNHNCDICNKKVTDCVDSNRDYCCDICGGEVHYRNRLEGENRWETALLTADEMKVVLGVERFQTMIIASGSDFADAMAGSYLAAVKDAPILLSWGKGGEHACLDETNIAYIRENLAENGMVYILGGEKAVPRLYEVALGGLNVKRLGGANRFETNRQILQEAGVTAGEEILVCTGMDYADCLSASATGKPILLVAERNGQIYGLDEAYLRTLQGSRFTIIGGKNAVSDRLAQALADYGTVERLAGENRVETSVRVAKTYFVSPNAVVLASGGNYPDGLCGGTLAYAKGAPMLMILAGYEQATADYLAENGITSATIMGGQKAVGDQTVSNLFG